MTDVLLTHSYHLGNDQKQLRKMQPYAPLGTLYAATALEQAGITLRVFDSTLLNPIDHLGPVLKETKPNIVVIYEDDFNFLSKMCLLSMRQTAQEIAKLAKLVGAIVVAHGSDETDFAAEYLQGGVDYILTGEAEEVLVELCGHLMAGRDPRATPGLIWRDPASNEICRSGSSRVRNGEWSAMPRPARRLIDMAPYRQAWTNAHGHFSANVVASRGCPYSCNWCAKPISGNRYQVRPAQDVALELKELKEVYGVQHVWFSDDIFALNRRWLRDFAHDVEAHRASIPYKIQARADLITDEVAALLAKSGCVEVWMGVESGSQKVLDAMDKHLRVSDVLTSTKRLQQRGIKACFFLQLGYPGEGWSELMETVELVRKARPNDIGVSISYPLPGTLFYERIQAELAAKRNWQDSDDLCVIFPGEYSDKLYRMIRDALHEEVRGWGHGVANEHAVAALWAAIVAMEPAERRHPAQSGNLLQRQARNEHFVPLQMLTAKGGVA
ncbi:B12-binding domain-containing radical SAM protein [Silvibacterium acidisoli]|uniref:B12-binding domain-containing radical SAM protein n=1 Tax=Acidobacteriaceae bacterium ZG23-2 TaxID=2883246 RepID=UPI00406C11F8